VLWKVTLDGLGGMLFAVILRGLIEGKLFSNILHTRHIIPPPLVIFIFYVNFCYALCHRWNYPPIICFNIFIFDPAQQIPSLGKKQSLIYPAHGCQSRNKKIAMALVASSMA
jgi:hypothetical protein